ncbi:hypothetical protein WP1W18C01_19440 [Stenotrophomonas maltophilia]|nr:hypothetical protein WP1W18C01_19440 [Stenotrophomonas maltophilia]
MQLASRFASRSPALRSERPLSDDQIRAVAPSIFAEAPHESRSERYAYIPTATVLQELRGEGFEPFIVTLTRVRHDDRRDYTKHMIRLRHASQINGREANEIILLNSHDGTSSYQMLAGHSGLTSRQAHSTNPRQARNSPSTTPSSKCRSGSAATRQRSAACNSSNTVSAPTIARSVLARLTRRPGETSVSGQGCPSAPSQPRMRLRMPRR